MDFISVILFLFLYYIRPQEWIPGVAMLRPVTLVMAFALIAMVARERGFKLKEVFKTPHDYLMLAYFLWIVLTATDRSGTFSSVYNLFAFYVVTALALSTFARIRTYLFFWAGLIMAIALFALGSEYGIDLMDSNSLTHDKMKGRLSLNLSIFENPNVLGHSVGPLLLMLYFLMIWKQPIFVRVAAIPLFFFPAYCIYLTYSKGAFLACFATGVAAMAYRRPKIVQMWVLIGAVTVGWAAVTQLPRMAELSSARSDPAIYGRILAFDYGLKAMEANTTGIGYGNFRAGFYREHRFAMTPHSSYVHIGSQLGYLGLFLFCGIIYCCIRTLMTARDLTPEEERVRRILFVLLVSFVISSWMIDWAFRAYFFLIVAAIAAFHRHLLEREKESAAEALGKSGAGATSVVDERPVMALASDGSAAARLRFAGDGVAIEGSDGEEGEEERPAKGTWNRIGPVDIGLMVALTWATVYFWRYVMLNI